MPAINDEINSAASANLSDLAGPAAGQTSLLIDAQFLEVLRQQMHKFATQQLSDSDLAEDAVQEALVGALKNAKSFTGRASLKTWVFAILKNKIADVLRQKQRLVYTGSLMYDVDDNEDLSELFNAKGFWQIDERPSTWGNPQEALHQGQFWNVFELCLENLPGMQGRVFMMKEFIELDSAEICAEVNITVSNLNVLLHRARLRLRECLEDRWFKSGSTAC
jgi:RNA polymerase sigma-70 factor (ECF subfamily)